MAYWYEPMDTPRIVTLDFNREQYEDGVCIAKETFANPDGQWIARGDAHYITYEENANDVLQKTRTTIRLSADELTLIRHGAIRWNHSFREGRKASSTMHIGTSALSVETWTKELKVNVSKQAGEVSLTYQIDLSDTLQLVKLFIRFGGAYVENRPKTTD